MTHARLLQYTTLSISIALFILCLTNDGYYIAGPDPRAWAPGWGLFLFGWIGIFSGTVSWVANPLLLYAWVMFFLKRYRRSAMFAFGALVLMLAFLMSKTVVSSEAPTYSRIVGYGTGYWLWIASAAILLIGTLTGERLRGKLPSAQGF